LIDSAKSSAGAAADWTVGVADAIEPTSAISVANSRRGADGTGIAPGAVISDWIVSPSSPIVSEDIEIGGAADGVGAPPCPTWSVNSNCIAFCPENPRAF